MVAAWALVAVGLLAVLSNATSLESYLGSGGAGRPPVGGVVGALLVAVGGWGALAATNTTGGLVSRDAVLRALGTILVAAALFISAQGGRQVASPVEL
ncbi:hypothetical protein CHLRE_09g388912v5 [Chlamydomonas reinhardtii]|uniref:Integral membrane protein n=1 Tax=Chlamydomonas reinhardtii TaxID=3055 RepID=A0A2K3DDY7_CHLRE|nr:uncharacterized protein CHLRE_09g388912v5 [Chlamydomonas reinhardtii]PNW78752.1 hypothetical protein CHLRE_09g388912v5 [Chlamydomonas reinhardtii]